MAFYVSGTRPSAAPESDQAGASRPTPWWETPYGRWRLSVEAEAMKRFPDFTCCRDPYGVMAWIGSLRSSFDHDRAYFVKLSYPPTFPDDAPMVAILSPELPNGTPHLLEGNRPCLYQASQGPRNGYDPARTTAATLVAWTALWIHAFETWRSTGRWPGAET
jgi:hypothetical protein